MRKHFPPTIRGGTPIVKTYLVETKEARSIGENDSAGLDHAKNVAETEFKLAKVLKSAREQDAIVGF
jgi:hypothetical protein